MVVDKGQFGTGIFVRWTALACLFLALLMTGVEVTHVHAGASVSQHSTCALCLSVHANAPALTLYVLPALYTLDVVAIAYKSRGKSAVSELWLFIRPPPSV